MTEGTSQGLFVVVAIVIFGIFVGLSYTIFGNTLKPGLVTIFEYAFVRDNGQGSFDKDKEYNVEGVTPNAETDFVFDNVDTIIGYVGTSTEVVIPKTINGKEVTTISGDAFNAKGITKLIMPNSITTIEDGSLSTVTASINIDDKLATNDVEEYSSNKNTFSTLFDRNNFIMTVSAAETSRNVIGAFANNDIKEISMSANVEYIGSFAFFAGTLDEVILPEGLVQIGESAFEDNLLKNIYIPSTVKNLGNNSFKSNNISNVNYGKGSLNIGQGSFSGNNLGSITIPNGTKSISEGAYKDSGLTEVYIPEGITSIGKDAFAGNDLTKVTIPETVTVIEDGAFKENVLTEVNLPKGLTSIGDYAFYKNLLPVVSLPESLLNIGTYAFYENKLEDVTIPTKLTEIKPWTFAYNQMPKKPLIPVNIKTEGEHAFFGNLFTEAKPQSEYYGGNTVVMTKSSDFNFDPSTGTILKYTGTDKQIVVPYAINGVEVTSLGSSSFLNLKITSIILPTNLKRIEKNALFSNDLRSIVLHEGITYVGDSALAYNGLSAITFPRSITYIGKGVVAANIISGSDSMKMMYIPKEMIGKLDKYASSMYISYSQSYTYPSKYY